MIIIGGGEDKYDRCEILKNVVSRAKRKDGPIILLTAATLLPAEVSKEYHSVFNRLGFSDVRTIDIRERSDVNNVDFCNELASCSCIFFTGGDQLKITSLMGGTGLYESLKGAARSGTLIVGTSAGASCLCTTMIVSGIEEDSPRKCTIKMAPGLDIIRGVIIDQHFAQRGRTGRLLNAVAQNPGLIGIGIDENSAINFENSSSFYVTGAGAVTVVDGRGISHTNVSELAPDEILSITDIKMHVLPRDYGYDLSTYSVLLHIKEEKNGTN